MVRIRRVPTTMRSAKHLVRALEAVGLQHVERFPAPQPLLSWRNQPLPVSAEIIVRRGQIGSTADDLGFTRDSDGTYVALVSEILLGHFDRRWWAEFERHYKQLLAADGGVEDIPPPVFGFTPTPRAEPPPAPAHVDHRRAKESERKPQPPPERAPQREPERASEPADAQGDLSLERELSAVLGAAVRAGKMRGCLPLAVLWLALALASLVTRNGPLFAFSTLIISVIAIRMGKQRFERMADAAALEFKQRFARNDVLRAAAIQRLRRELATLPPERKTVVELLLKRLGG